MLSNLFLVLTGFLIFGLGYYLSKWWIDWSDWRWSMGSILWARKLWTFHYRHREPWSTPLEEWDEFLRKVLITLVTWNLSVSRDAARIAWDQELDRRNPPQPEMSLRARYDSTRTRAVPSNDPLDGIFTASSLTLPWEQERRPRSSGRCICGLDHR